MQGRVVGINTAIVSGGSGIGFAIPIDIAKEVVGKLMKGGKISRGWLGVVVQPVTDDIAESMGLSEARGALVADVLPDGPAAKAGIERGDVIVQFDGRPVDRQSQLPYMVATHSPGATVTLELIRKGSTKTMSVTLGERRGEGMGEEEPGTGTPETEENLGMTVQELTPDMSKHLGIVEEGVIVTEVSASGPASRAGIRRNDVIVEVNQKPVKDLKSYKKALDDPEKKESALFAILRGKTTSYVVVKYPKKDKK
jgi:serine protease Do